MNDQTTAYREIVLAELSELSSNPDITKETIKEKLGDIWHHAGEKGDETTQALVMETWEKVESLSLFTQTAIVLMAAAKELSDQLSQQRDHAVTLYSALKKDIESVNTTNPDVASLKEALEADAYEDALESAQADLIELWDSGSDFYQRLAVAESLLDLDTTKQFWDYIGGMEELTEEEELELATFIKTWTAKVSARVEHDYTVWLDSRKPKGNA